MSDNDGWRLVLGSHQRERFLLTEISAPDVPDPVGIGVLERSLRQLEEEQRDSLGDSPQDRVRERNGPLEVRAAHELYRLVHGGVLRDAAEVAELVRAEAQRGEHRWVELSHRPLPERLDRVIERPQALYRAERQLACECPVAIVEAFRGRPQRTVGVGALLGDAPEDVIGRLAGRRDFHQRRPRRKASYSIRLPPSGCTSSGTSSPVLEPRAPDRDRPSVQLAARPDVRRERANPVQALDRTGEVEQAVVGLDLRGVGRLALLRPEHGLGQHFVQQLDRELCCTVVEGPRIVLRRHEKRALRSDRAGVELLDRLVDRDAGLGVARKQGALDRGRPTPARQQRRVHVQPHAALEQIVRDQQSVSDDDDRLGRKLELGRRPLGLQNGNPEPLGGELRGRSGDLAAPAGGPVGACQQRRDVVAGGEPLEHVRAERGRGGNRDLHAREATSSERLAQRAERFAARLVGRALEHQHPVEVVDLMLDDAGVHLVQLESKRRAGEVLRPRPSRPARARRAPALPGATGSLRPRPRPRPSAW